MLAHSRQSVSSPGLKFKVILKKLYYYRELFKVLWQNFRGLLRRQFKAENIYKQLPDPLPFRATENQIYSLDYFLYVHIMKPS